MASACPLGCHRQVLVVFARYSNVRWPPLFNEYLTTFEWITIDLFTVVPLDCLDTVGGNIKFYWQVWLEWAGVAATVEACH